MRLLNRVNRRAMNSHAIAAVCRTKAKPRAHALPRRAANIMAAWWP
jgi:hypothetical protein